MDRIHSMRRTTWATIVLGVASLFATAAHADHSSGGHAASFHGGGGGGGAHFGGGGHYGGHAPSYGGYRGGYSGHDFRRSPAGGSGYGYRGRPGWGSVAPSGWSGRYPSGWNGGYRSGWGNGYRGGWGGGYRGGWGGGYRGGWGGIYVGAYLPVLPWYCDTFWYGGIPYYYGEGTYFVWDPGVQEYEVVDPPADVAEAAPAPAPPAELYVYPHAGQTQEQISTDRYQCYRSAADQTGFDPTRASGGVDPARAGALQSDYQRAEAACLEARGYTVR